MVWVVSQYGQVAVEPARPVSGAWQPAHFMVADDRTNTFLAAGALAAGVDGAPIAIWMPPSESSAFSAILSAAPEIAEEIFSDAPTAVPIARPALMNDPNAMSEYLSGLGYRGQLGVASGHYLGEVGVVLASQLVLVDLV